jgi:hypothetical protein
MDFPEPPADGDEVATLLGSLERQRATFAWKTGDLDAAGMRASHPPSSITLGGLVKHLALIEDFYFQSKWLGQELGPPWDNGDLDADPDWEWSSAADDEPAELIALWHDAVQRSRTVVREALADGDLGQLSPHPWPDGQTPRLRRVIVDLVEEYGRHVGHADLIRESIDGRVGEDPPGRPVPFAGP